MWEAAVVALFLGAMGENGAPLTLVASANRVGRYRKIEFTIDGAAAYDNPFDPGEVDVRLELTAPGGERLEVPGFYYQPYMRRRMERGGRQRDWFYPSGQAVWRARFAPNRLGRWTAVAVLRDRRGKRQSPAVEFHCVPSGRKGYVRVSQRDPRFLELDDGSPFFAVGQNLAFIGSGQHVDLGRAEAIFERLAACGANWLRVWTCCGDWAMAIEARKSAWGRSWHWNPPFVPMPGAPADSGQKCVGLSPERRSVELFPSHPVGLRPNTAYELTGRLRLEGAVRLRMTLFGRPAAEFSTPGPEPEWTALKHKFVTRADTWWLGPIQFTLEGDGRAWLDGLALHEAAGGPNLLWEAEVNRPVVGRFNPVDCFMLDQLLAAAERNGIYLQLCLLTRDLYMSRLKDEDSAEYQQAIDDAKRFFRYAVARWGYSTAVGAWEYWNEMNPNLPTGRFYTELGHYLERIDVYRHLRKTSTWGPSIKDARHPQLDVADVHFYLRPAERKRLANEVAAVLDRADFLRQYAPRKPALIGEFGLATDQWRLSPSMGADTQLSHLHNSLWASALSGLSGTVLFWWWEQLDRMNAYPHYRPLSAFVARIPFTSGQLKRSEAVVTGAEVQVIGLQGDERAYLWLFNPQAAWVGAVEHGRQPAEISGAVLVVPSLRPGTYRVDWWDTYQGQIVRREGAATTGKPLKVPVPPFSTDVACQIEPGRQQP